VRLAKEHEREWARKRKEVTRHVVVLHSEGSGFVVRTGQVQADGRVALPYPYGDAEQLFVSKSEKIAQNKADRMNKELT